MGLILSYPLFSLVYLLYTAYLHVSKKIETAKNTVMTTYSLACAYLLLFSVTLLFKKVHLWASLPISLQVKLNKKAFCENIPVLVKNMFYKTTKSVRWSRRTKRYKCLAGQALFLFQCYWYLCFLKTNSFYQFKCHK